MEEANIPVFSVLKKGKTLKNIFLNYPTTESGKPLSPSVDREPVLIGRHPDCHIVVDHPSISRFHLEIMSNPTLHKLFVIDRSSVHGTWVSGKKVQPDIPFELSEGDTLKLGLSTRIYRLHWMPLSCAFEMEKPMSPLMEEASEFTDNENVLQDNHSNEIWASHVIPSAPPMPEILKDSSPRQIFDQDLDTGGQNLVREKKLKKSPCFSCIASLLESVNSSRPLEDANGTCENILVSEMQVERENPSPVKLNQKVKPSSLLSRRNKSITFLEIEKTSLEYRSDIKNEKGYLEIEEQFVGVVAGGNVQGKNSSVLVAEDESFLVIEEQTVGAVAGVNEEEKNSILVAEDNMKEEEEESSLSDKENMTPVISIGSKVLKGSRMIEKSTLSSSSIFNNDDLEIEDKRDGESMRSEEAKVFIFEGHAAENKEEKFASNKPNITLNSNGSMLMMSNQDIETSPLSSIRLLNKDGLEFERKKNGAFVGGNVEEKIPLALFTDRDEKEEGEMFASDMENFTPVNSIGSKTIKSKSKHVRSPLRSFSICKLDKEHSDSPKENRTSESIVVLKSNKPGIRLRKEKGDAKFSQSNNLECLSSTGVKLQRSLFKSERTPQGGTKILNAEENRLLSDTEKTPEPSNSLKAKKANARDLLNAEGEEKRVSGSDKENLTPQNSMKSKKVPSENLKKMEGATVKRRKERIPFQPLFESSSPLRNSSPASSVPNNDNKCCNKYANNDKKSEEKVFGSHYKEELPHIPEREKKKWYIVVDAACLLTEESRKSIQLLEGIRGTQLIIPRIVIRELDHLKRCQGILNRGTTASSVLQWIEESMLKTSWWIHVQSTSETFPLPPTPPATPRLQLCDSSKYTAFSTCGSFMEIVSPTAEDHILECALLFKKIRSEDGQLMLLTSSTTLRIKARAEGLLCETPKEFRESLVNPFSKRFLWMDSSPRGSTWSCLEEVVLPENCRQQLRMPKADGTVKGLKLILLHSSNFGTSNST